MMVDGNVLISDSFPNDVKSDFEFLNIDCKNIIDEYMKKIDREIRRMDEDKSNQLEYREYGCIFLNYCLKIYFIDILKTNNLLKEFIYNCKSSDRFKNDEETLKNEIAKELYDYIFENESKIKSFEKVKTKLKELINLMPDILRWTHEYIYILPVSIKIPSRDIIDNLYGKVKNLVKEIDC